MKYKLEELFDLQMGKTPSRSNPDYWNTEDNKWISIGDLSQAGKYICETKEYISNNAVDESGIKVIPANTVIMSFKLSIGKTAITSEDMYSNEAIMAFHDKHVVELIPEYIYYMFKYKNWDEGTNKAVLGKTLNKATLSKVEIEVCDIEQQKEIVKVLDKLSTILEYRNTQILSLDELIKSQFVEMFGDPVRNDKEWERSDCKKLASKIGSGATPKGGNSSYKEEGIALIRSMNVYNNTFQMKDLAYIDDEQAKKLDNVTVEKDDVLLNITGASVARCCIVPEELIPARVNQHVSIIRCKQDKLNPIFLSNMLTNDSYQKLLWSIATSGGATREALTKQQVEDLEVIIPTKELQQQFANFVQQVDKLKFEIQKSLDETQILFESLMQKYFG